MPATTAVPPCRKGCLCVLAGLCVRLCLCTFKHTHVRLFTRTHACTPAHSLTYVSAHCKCGHAHVHTPRTHTCTLQEHTRVYTHRRRHTVVHNHAYTCSQVFAITHSLSHTRARLRTHKHKRAHWRALRHAKQNTASAHRTARTQVIRSFPRKLDEASVKYEQVGPLSSMRRWGPCQV